MSDLQAELAQFTGTENYHRFGMRRNVVATDGVKYLAENAKAYWLLDAIASYQGDKRITGRLRDMQFWNLTVKGRGAILTCRADDGIPPAITQEIEYTDFPLPSIDLWVGCGDLIVIMLPSEY